jgi:hypothetical protein
MNIYIKLPPTNIGIGNGLKAFITYLSLSDNVKIEDKHGYLLGDYSSILNSNHIYKGEPNYYPKFTWRFLILNAEEQYQKNISDTFMDDIILPHHVFSHKVYIDLVYDKSLISEQVFQRIMRGIDKIVWSEKVITEVNKIKDDIGDNCLGISVRTWKASHEKNIDRQYNVEDYKNAINKFITNKKIKNIFLSVDYNPAYIEYQELLKDYNVISYHSHDVTELQRVCIKVLALSKCRYFIGSKSSTFTELVFWLSRCSQEIIVL